MKKGRNPRGARCRIRWSAALALAAIVVLTPSLAWSQAHGRAGGVIPLPVPGSELNKLKLTAYSPGFDSAGLVHRNFTPLPQPGSQLNKLKLTTYSPTLETSGLFQRNFIPLPQPGSELNKLKLTTFESQGGGFGSYVLRRFVMVAFP